MTVTIPGFGEILAWKAAAPPFAVFLFGIYYKYVLGGPVWATRVGLFLEEERWTSAYGRMLWRLRVWLRWIFGRQLMGMRTIAICGIITVFYSIGWIIWSSFAQAISSNFYLNTLSLIFVIFYILLFITITIGSVNEIKMKRHIKFITIIIFVLYIISIFLVKYIESTIIEKQYKISENWIMQTAFFIFVVSITLYVALLSLPIINISFDIISVMVTRYLLEALHSSLQEVRFLFRITYTIVFVTIDVLILFVLCASKSIILILNYEIGPVWLAARDTPFTFEGSILSVMLLSTLVPTALHLFCAVFAILPALPFGHQWAASFIPARYEDFEPGDKAVVAGFLTIWTLISLAALYGIFWAGVQVLDMITLQFEWPDGQHRDLWRSIFHIAEAVAGAVRG